MSRPVSIAYTPDSDDAFYYFALETGRLDSGQFDCSFRSDHIMALNGAAREQRYDVTAISSVAYPELADRYRILSVGTSVGRGYGPVLVSRRYASIEALRGRRIGVAGTATTGGFLAKWAGPQSELVEMRFDLIADAVAAGELDAGVMIHEELLYYPRKGLRQVADLGAVWCERTGLPLPVGLNCISRRFDLDQSDDMCDLIRGSLVYALEHREAALRWACRFGRGDQGGCGEKHISMFANADSVHMPRDVRTALALLFQWMRKLGVSDHLPPIEIVDGSLRAGKRALAKVESHALV
ncbi:MAG TPA: MqnA/MqnD/SBP family protein [Pirellulales bacterium]|nr:MqnA/MqnD/SBP family protein [Pirellulales bacterium]